MVMTHEVLLPLLLRFAPTSLYTFKMRIIKDLNLISPLRWGVLPVELSDYSLSLARDCLALRIAGVSPNLKRSTLTLSSYALKLISPVRLPISPTGHFI